MTSVWAFDEGRFGLKATLRRRWCPRGVRPPWIVDERYEWLWVYLAVEPLTGDCFVLYLPHVDSACLQLFADHFAAYLGDRRVGLVLDGSGTHQATTMRWPEQLVRLPLPPYSPELNPAETVFRLLRAELSNRCFQDLDELEAAITAVFQQCWAKPGQLRSRTGYPWWLAAAQAITNDAA